MDANGKKFTAKHTTDTDEGAESSSAEQPRMHAGIASGGLEIHHEDDEGRATNRKPVQKECRLRIPMPSGNGFHLEGLRALVRGGRFIRWYGSVEDIRERRETEEIV